MLTYKLRSALRVLFLGIVLLGSSGVAQAVVTTLTFKPNPVDLNDLDHHMVYTWRLDNLPTSSITVAKLTFTNIANWNNNTNMLFIHLLDTAKNPGVASFVDDPNASNTNVDIDDDFVDTRYHSDPNWLVAPGTADRKLVQKSFTTTPVNYTYTFTAADLTKLNAFIKNGGDIAFGFDPDCHYFNDGISFSITTNISNLSPVPEVQAFMPLTGVIGLAMGVQTWRRRRDQALVS